MGLVVENLRMGLLAISGVSSKREFILLHWHMGCHVSLGFRGSVNRTTLMATEQEVQEVTVAGRNNAQIEVR
jgi:hypothetical protein